MYLGGVFLLDKKLLRLILPQIGNWLFWHHLVYAVWLWPSCRVHNTFSFSRLLCVCNGHSPSEYTHGVAQVLLALVERVVFVFQLLLNKLYVLSVFFALLQAIAINVCLDIG